MKDDLISRQEAIKKILLCENHDMEHDFEFNQGLIVAMNAIEELPTANPSTTLMKVEVGVDKESLRKLRKAMEEAELTLLPAEKKGKWLVQFNGWGDVYYECSCCKAAITLIEGTPTDNLYYYCPVCGARMEE